MNNIVTVFGDGSLSFDMPFLLNLLFYFIYFSPYIAAFISLICMFARKWTAAVLLAIVAAMFAVLSEEIISMMVFLGFAVIVCGIAILARIRKKRLELQQGSMNGNMQFYNGTDNTIYPNNPYMGYPPEMTNPTYENTYYPQQTNGNVPMHDDTNEN